MVFGGTTKNTKSGAEAAISYIYIYIYFFFLTVRILVFSNMVSNAISPFFPRREAAGLATLKKQTRNQCFVFCPPSASRILLTIGKQVYFETPKEVQPSQAVLLSFKKKTLLFPPKESKPKEKSAENDASTGKDVKRNLLSIYDLNCAGSTWAVVNALKRVQKCVNVGFDPLQKPTLFCTETTCDPL